MNQIACEKCDNKLKEGREFVPFESKVLGKILVPGVHHYKCSKCGSSLISYEGAGTLLKYVSEKELEAIRSLPIGDFVSLNEAADILEISKQAFNKNTRIKRGFIYSTIVGGRRVYYKKSVEEFKRTGNKDGRIKLSAATHEMIKHVDINPFSSRMPSHRATFVEYRRSMTKTIAAHDNFYHIKNKPKEKRYN